MSPTPPRPRRPTVPVGGDARTVAVTRSGGFAGLVQRGAVDLDSDDPRAREVAGLLERIDFTALEQRAHGEGSAGPAGADRYVYEFDCPGVRLQASEALLDDDERRLAARSSSTPDPIPRGQVVRVAMRSAKATRASRTGPSGSTSSRSLARRARSRT